MLSTLLLATREKPGADGLEAEILSSTIQINTCQDRAKRIETAVNNFECGTFNQASHVQTPRRTREKSGGGAGRSLQCRDRSDTPTWTSKASNRSNSSALR